MNDIKVTYVDTMSIKPYNRNARKNSVTVDKLCEILPKVGFNQPIVIDKNNVIVKGHSRWQAAIRLGMEKIPVIVSENDEETNKLDRLADNKLHEFSDWDDDLLKTELMSINLDDFDLSDLGFDTDFEVETAKIEKFLEPPVMFSEYDSSEEEHVPQVNNPAPQRVEAQHNVEEDKEFITPADVMKTVPVYKEEYGYVTCPKCGETVLYRK